MTFTTIVDIAREAGADEATLKAALEAYRRKHGKSKPPGTSDSAGRFYLSERAPCCDAIRSPSRSFPLSEWKHGKSDSHVASVFQVRESDVRFLRKLMETVEAGDCISMHARLELAAKIDKALRKGRKSRA